MKKRVVIVGGGISGLAAAYRLLELARTGAFDLDVTILEASPRAGGLIATEKLQDFLVEWGPDSFLTDKPWGLGLCDRLGLREHLVSPDVSRQRLYVVHKGRLERMPRGFLLMAPTQLWPVLTSSLFSWPGKLRMLCDLVLPRGRAGLDESLSSFVERRLGVEVLERAAQPLMAGIYGADPRRLSLSATMPRFAQLERSHRSIILGLRAGENARPPSRDESGARWSLFTSLDRGMGSLVGALLKKLPPSTVQLNAGVLSLDRNGLEWCITLENGSIRRADAVILAVPAHRASAILSSFDTKLAPKLGEIPFSSVASVTLGYRTTDIPHGLDGFGFVSPAIEKRSVMACTFSSIKYPGRAPRGHDLLRAWVGGAMQPELLDLSDTTLEQRVKEELRELLNIHAPPVFTRVRRYPLSMPQYTVGHLARVDAIEARVASHGTLALAGNSYRGVGVPDAIHSGEDAAAKVLSMLANR